MNNLNIKKGDNVIVLTGKDRGKKGEVVATSPKSGKIIVAEVNMQKKHVKPRNAQQPGGIVDQAGPIDASNVMVVCPKCGKGTRVANEIKNGKKVRICKKCGAEIVFAAKSSKKAAKKDDDAKTAKKTKAKKAEAVETVATEEAAKPKTAKKTTKAKAEAKE